MSGKKTTVSIILAIRNEKRSIEAAITSLLAQQGETFDLELLAIDGMSTDGTRDIVARMAQTDRRIRLLDNPRFKTPFAFNIGLNAARGEYVSIFGAHAVYDPDYIETCLREMDIHGAAGVSGRVVTVPYNDGLDARLTAVAMGHPFGSSSNSVRTQPEGFVDTIPYPVFKKQLLIDLGGYNENLIRNQDNDMNQRLRKAGHRLYCTWNTKALYRARKGLVDLGRYGLLSGKWNVLTLRHNAASMSLRHFAPLFFVLAVLGCLFWGAAASFVRLGAFYSWAPLAGVLGAHVTGGFAGAFITAVKGRFPAALALPLYFIVFHFTYGLGSLQMLIAPASLEKE